MRKVIIDIETESLTPNKIWVAICIDIDTEEVFQFLNIHENNEDRKKFVEFSKEVGMWIAHNGINFDVPVLKRIVPEASVNIMKVIDTLVVSRMKEYNIPNGHSLDAWGKRLGNFKTEFHSFEQLSQEMIDYCIQDCKVTLKLYREFKPYIFDKKNCKALRVEHDMAIICNDMKNNGFSFDYNSGVTFMQQMDERLAVLEEEFQVAFPPELEEVNRIKYRVKADGSLYANVEKAKEKYALTQRVGEELVCYDYILFEPSSPKKRIDRLWQAGWEPIQKTKGLIDWLRERPEERDESKRERFEKYGWTCDEVNLATLPDTAPEGAHKLAEWITLNGRKLILTQWLEAYNKDTGRIHGSFTHIGSWTGRMSHKNPNAANIFSPFHGEVKTAVDKVKDDFDGKLRALWNVPDNHYLVGTDAEGIQLRILAHLINNPEYIDAVANGVKEDKTDIHNVNLRALGVDGITRDDAKTFIYAWLLGASPAKVGQILRVSTAEAEDAMERFMSSIDGLKRLKKVVIPQMAQQGFFTGVDGRRVPCSSEHLMLAGLLQNGETVVMKHANRLWRKWAKEKGIWFKQVNFVHDEWQTEVRTMEDAEALGELQRLSIVEIGKELNIKCPLAGSTDIGKNWAETH